MYVCNCNGITQRQVRAAKEAGARKWTDVHAHFQCQPQCGGCGAEIANMLQGPDAKQSIVLMPASLAKA